MEEIRAFLSAQVAAGNWTFQVPGVGLGLGKTLLAKNDIQKAIVLLDADCHALSLLAEKGITPWIAGSGHTTEGRSFCVQPFIEGTHPDEAWYAINLARLAERLSTLQSHKALREHLQPPADETYRSLYQKELKKMMDGFDQIPDAHPQKQRIHALLQAAQTKINRITGSGLVPCHGDMNQGNFLISGDHVYLIDWEHLTLSDPLNDPANLLWWAIPKSHWYTLFEIFGFDFSDSNIVERFYLIPALRALKMYVLMVLHQFDRTTTRFLEDAGRALNHQEPASRLVDWGSLGESQ